MNIYTSVYCGGQLRDISEDSEVGVTIIQQFRHLGPFTHPLSSSPSVDHGPTFSLLGPDKIILAQAKLSPILFCTGTINWMLGEVKSNTHFIIPKKSVQINQLFGGSPFQQIEHSCSNLKQTI